MSVTTAVTLKKVVLNFWNLYSIFIIVLYSFPVFFYFFSTFEENYQFGGSYKSLQ